MTLDVADSIPIIEVDECEHKPTGDPRDADAHQRRLEECVKPPVRFVAVPSLHAVTRLSSRAQVGPDIPSAVFIATEGFVRALNE